MYCKITKGKFFADKAIKKDNIRGNKIIIALNFKKKVEVSSFEPNVASHIETSHLTCTANQMTGFHMKCNSG